MDRRALGGGRRELRRWIGAALVAVVATGTCVSGSALAQGSGPPADEILVPVESATKPASEPAPPVALDDLLRLPRGYGSDVESRGGASPPEWRERFATARAELDAAKKKLAQLDAEIGEISGSASAWSVSAPGSQDPQASPLSLRLRQEMKEQRVRIQEAERSLRALHVEADLADVPPAWRE